MWSFLTLPLNINLICVASQHLIPTLRLFLKTFKNFPQGKNNFPWESHGIPMGIPWEIWNSENNNQQHNYKVYRLSTSAVNRFCICLSNLHINYTLQVPQKRYIGTFKILAFFPYQVSQNRVKVALKMLIPWVRDINTHWFSRLLVIFEFISFLLDMFTR